MSNKLEKLDLFKLPSILFCAAYWKVGKFSNPSSAEERTRQLLHPGSCSPSVPSSHMHRQTVPRKSKLAVFGKKCTQEPRSDLKI